MDRNIAIVTHELSSEDVSYLKPGLDRYRDYPASQGIQIDAPIVGDISNIIGPTGLPYPTATPQGDGSVLLRDVNDCIGNIKLDAEYVLNGFTDLFLVISRRMMNPTTKGWHVKARGGEAYGGACNLISPESPNGSYGFATMHPLGALDSQKSAFIDYLFTHEFGHMFGGFQDLGPDAEDNPMKPIGWATDEHLKAKVLRYTDEQLNTIKANMKVENIETILGSRVRTN